MASASKIIDDVNTLSVQLSENFKLLNELDEKTRMIMCNADKEATYYLLNHKKLPESVKNHTLANVQKQFKQAHDYGDDKVQLSIQTYELVDRQIRNLDSFIENLETKMQNKGRNNNNAEYRPQALFKNINGNKESKIIKDQTVTTTTASTKKKPRTNGGRKTRSSSTVNTPAMKVVTKSNKSTNIEKNCTSKIGNDSGNAVHSNFLWDDMPIDPNEPKFCLCQNVSYGQMIMCDDLNCSIEWFHFECVKLTTKPEGNWFCPNCIKKNLKKKKN